MYALDLKVMGCEARLALDCEEPACARALEGVASWLVQCEQLLTRFDPASALGQLNERGLAAHVDEVLWTVVEAALTAADSTGGLITPTVLGALEEAGYDRSFDALEGLDRARTAAAGGERSAVPDWRAVELDALTRSIRLPPGTRLDLGGVAKGWCADAAAFKLGVLGPALVDLGGDIAMTDLARRWPIAIEDPRSGGDPLDVLLLRRGGVATSGTNVRRWRRGGATYHHVIDPRSGAPASTDVLTATVVADSALGAETAAKRVVIEGCEAGLAWIDARPELAALVVRDDGRVVRSRRLDGYTSRSAP